MLNTTRFSLANALAIQLLAKNPEWRAVPSGTNMDNGYYEILGGGDYEGDIHAIYSAIRSYLKLNPTPNGYTFIYNHFEKGYANDTGKRVAFLYQISSLLR